MSAVGLLRGPPVYLPVVAPTWKSVPALRATLALCVGVVAAANWPDLPARYVAAAGALGAAAFFLPTGLVTRARMRGLGLTILLAAGGCAYMLHRGGTHPAPVSDGGGAFVARLSDAPSGRGDWLGTDAVLLSSGGHGEHVRLMFERPVAGDGGRVGADSLSAGAVIVSDADLRPVGGPRNPDAFDYRALLAARGIARQAWVRSGDYTLVRAGPPPGPLAKVRAWIAGRIDAGFGHARDAGVAKALLLGDKSGIDEETRLTYTATGAVHVLAVSGLHTGIISAVVVFLLARVFGKAYPGLQFGVLLLALATYAALTGFAPSVIRASVMFAVVFGGRFWQRDARGLNSLGVAAALTLLYDPSLLLTLGFQLSYFAVAGIMLFYRPLRRRLLTPYRRLDGGSELLAVSLAATLGTAPVTVYYFHQFPIYFALSGLVAVPLVGWAITVLLPTIALDAVLSLFGTTWTWMYKLAHGIVWCCNEALALFAELPYVLLEGLYPSASLAVVLLVTIWSAGVTLLTCRRQAMRLTMALVLLSTGLAVYELASARWDDEVIVYGLRDASVVDVRRGVYTLSASDGRASERVLEREVMPHRYATGYAPRRAAALAPVYSDSTMAFFAVDGVRWAEIRGGVGRLPPRDWSLDWVRVDDPGEVDPRELAAAFPDATVLLARRPPPWEADAWAALAARTHYLTDGAFVVPVADED